MVDRDVPPFTVVSEDYFGLCLTCVDLMGR